MLAEFFTSNGFWLYGGIFIALCLILKLFNYLTDGDAPEGCFTVLGIYMLIVCLFVWGVYNFGVALVFAALMYLCMFLIMLIGSKSNTAEKESKSNQESYEIIPRDFDTTSLTQMLRQVEFERQWSAVKFYETDLPRINNVDDSYKRRVLAMYDAVLRMGDKMVVCQSNDIAANVATMVYKNEGVRVVYRSLPWRRYSDGTIYRCSEICDGSITLRTAIPDNDHDYKCWWEYEHKDVQHYLINNDGLKIK